ncbi:hypothetical protein COB72_06460 [bacterium]|nr:MAG: hypothetical protein COB72_06460 [bacterium]
MLSFLILSDEHFIRTWIRCKNTNDREAYIAAVERLGREGDSLSAAQIQDGRSGYRIVRPFLASTAPNMFDSRLPMMAQDHKHDILLSPNTMPEDSGQV